MKKKTIIYIVVAIILVAASLFGTIALLDYLNKSDDTDTTNQETQRVEPSEEERRQDAAKLEIEAETEFQNGNHDAATSLLNEAKETYQDVGDDASAATLDAQIKTIEAAKDPQMPPDGPPLAGAE